MKLLFLRLEVLNPWSKDKFKNLGCLHGKLSKNKAWELEHTVYDGTLLDVSVSYTIREDHAGFELVLGVFTYGIGFRIYDIQHWDIKNNTWK